MSNSNGTHVSIGYGLGSIIAVTISWSINKSIFWCFLHGIFGWFYVIYFHWFVR